MKKRISITLNDKELLLIDSLLAAGIYGRSVPEVVRRLLDRELEQIISLPKFTVERHKKSSPRNHIERSPVDVE